MIDLSIIIVSWKMKKMLEELIHSIELYTNDITYEIIVVDNFSQDGTVPMIKEKFPKVILIENKKNRGVAPSRNQGIRVSKGRYILILDADMLLIENSLKLMVEFMDRTKDSGICGCMLISPEHIPQPNARRYPSLPAFILRRFAFLKSVRESRILRYHEMSDWDRKNIKDVDYLIGACQMIRRESMNAIGLLDEKIFYGPEDIDYCLRMYRGGWKVYLYPHTRIIHYEQRITKRKIFSKITFLHLCGIIYLFWKYKGVLRRT